MPERPVASWKFWQPFPFWQMIVILLVLNVVFQLLGVALREHLGLFFFTVGVAAGLAGGLGIGIVMFLAQKRRSANE